MSQKNASTGAVSTPALAWNPQALRQEVSQLIEVDLGPADEDVNLFELGLQSIQVMQLVNRINRTGIRVEFMQLADDARLSAWCELLRAAPRAASVTERPSSTGGGASRLDRADPFPLTAVQQAYWIGRGDDRTLGGVGCHAYLEIDAPEVDPERLESAVRSLVDLHPMLRATFGDDGNQRVLALSPWPGLIVHDFGEHTPESAVRALEELRESLSHRRLEVHRGEVLDVQLSRLPGSRHRLHINIDLLVCDVHSIRLLLSDLAALYEGNASPGELTYTFGQYLTDRAADQSAERARARDYWLRRLPELPGGPRLPLAVEPEALEATRFVRRTHELSPDEWSTLQLRAARTGVTPAVLLATAFSEVLSRWSGERRFLLNMPLFDRNHEAHPQIERIVADFTSLVLLEIDLSRGSGFAERCLAVQKQLHEDVGHAAYTGVDVLRDFVRADADAPRSAPVVFACNLDAPLIPDGFAARFGELSWMVSQTPQVWLDHQVYRTREGGLLLAWDAVEELFPAGVLDAMLAAYAALLRELLDADWRAAPELPLPDEQRLRREEVNCAPRVQSGRTLHQAFFERLSATADRPALLWGESGQLTHGELADRALRIGGALAGRGIGRGSSVVVTVPRGPDQIAAVLGVLATGATYVPVGVDQPAERRARILELSGARLVLEDGGAHRQPNSPGVHVLSVVDALCAKPLDRPLPADPDDTAYVIFTSGSTGTPKGVEVSHRAAVNTVEDIDERFRVGADDRVLAVSALDFDLSVWDIFGPLAEGGALVLVEESDRRDASQWATLCARHEVTVWNSVPALLDMLLTAVEGDRIPDSLRLAMLSGDWIGLDLPGRLAASTGGRCRLVGLGGATEAAIWSNAHEISEVAPHWRSIPYGKPLRNQKFRVVDGDGRDCPDWVTGELWIGGAGVALGYRADPELTAECFPEVAGERWYRTGDLGRYWPDGNLEFLGRLDQQVKINGFRVELGEIEAALQTHPQVCGAVVVTTGDRRRELVAALVENTGSTPQEGDTQPEEGGTREALHLAPTGDQQSPVTGGEPGPNAPGPSADTSIIEHQLVEAVLAEVVVAAVEPDSTSARALTPSEEQRPVLAAWVDHLVGRGVVGREGDALRPGRRWAEVRDPQWVQGVREQARGTHLEAIATALAWACPVLTAVISGEAYASVLLDDPVLSPEGLNDAMPGARECVAAIARDVAESTGSGAAPAAVAEWDTASGRGAARLLAGLTPGTVAYTLLGASLALLNAADARLAGSGHQVRTVHQGTTAIQAPQVHAFDAVVANNVLHRMESPEAAAAAMALLLKPGGRLYAVERASLSPLALLIALPLEAQAGRLRPSGTQTPWLHTGERWVRACAAAGLTGARVVSAYATGELLMTAERPPGAGGLDPDGLRRWMAERLPGHMVPEHLVALPALPLSANGKVDRRQVQTMLKDSVVRPREAADPPRGALEESLAALWKKLLGLASVGRDENFFTLGGDSLLATRLVTEVRTALGVELPMREVMRVPTVLGMSALVEELRSAEHHATTGDGAVDGDFEEGVL